MSLASEFREFAMKGSVIDLAVGVVIGASFSKIVDSLVADIIMPIVGILTGGYNFSKLSFKFGEAELKYGNFIQALLNFLIIAFVLFMVIKAVNRMKEKAEALNALRGNILPAAANEVK
ncbi:MAG: large conductance mechanosensitive channel protein MscL [Bacteroidia bacterium]|nr:large conductance mechanosensitive channel protein MscL [Bacteroidia bacterium]